MTASAPSILFITSNRLGDAVLSTGVLAHLIETHPNARITVACGPVPAPLFEPIPNVTRVLAMPKERFSGHWLRLLAQTIFTPWSLVVDLRSSATAYLLPTRRRLVLRKERQPIHKVRQLGALLNLDPPPAPRLWTRPEHDAQARQLLPDGGPVLALGPTANWGGKQWPAERFAEAARRLTALDGGVLTNARVAVFGAPMERAMAEPLLAALPPDRRIDVVGTVDLPTAAACLKRCALYIGNDSGLMHMAATTGIPTLGLFGPSPDEIYAPWGPNAALVRTPESFRDIIEAPDYDYRSQTTRMGSLIVERVVEAAEVLLVRTSLARASA